MTHTDNVTALLRFREGHFLLESGHHGAGWLDLERLCVRPEPIADLAAALVDRLRPYRIDAVCGPLVEGAFVGLLVAAKLRVSFTYAAPSNLPAPGELFPVRYRIPPGLRSGLAGARVAIVNDVVSAGSAIRGAHAELEDCGAVPVVVASLAVLGTMGAAFVKAQGMALETLAQLPYGMWTRADCPLCARQEPLVDARVQP